MLDKYIKFKEFNDWVTHNRFITKLLGDPIYYEIILEDNRNYQVIFYDGELYSYKFFIFCLDSYNLSIHYISSFRLKNKQKLEEHQKIIKHLIKNNIIKEEITYHPYHKNAKPNIEIRCGENYNNFVESIKNLNLTNVYELHPVIERAKNE